MAHTMSKAVAAMLAVVVAATAMVAFTAPAEAFFGGFGKSSSDKEVKVEVSNSATVSNEMKVEAETGDNDADGGDGEEGGNGGDVRGAGRGGNGGNGGHGAAGGAIVTGYAEAIGTISNDVNDTKTVINDGCGCEERGRKGRGGDDETKVKVNNTATVQNGMEVEAETGDNDANGGDGEEGGNGGDVEGVDEKPVYKSFDRFFSWKKGGDTKGKGGHGGNGGHGAEGGAILTGTAVADGLITNVVNRTVTRINR